MKLTWWLRLVGSKPTVTEASAAQPEPEPSSKYAGGEDQGTALLSKEDRTFIKEHISEVPGWLLDDAAYFSAYLLNWQHGNRIEGSMFEIGVYEGKFLLLLHHLSRRHENVTVGVDVFTHSRPEPIFDRARDLFGTSEGLVLRQMDSASLTPREAMGLVRGAPPRAISIDGDHRAEGVLKDLHLAVEIMAPRGVLIIDDFLNVAAIGVSEGFFRFFLDPSCGVVPFAAIANKVFACRKDNYELYLDVGRSFAAECTDLDVANRFTKNRDAEIHSVEQAFIGTTILTFL